MMHHDGPQGSLKLPGPGVVTLALAIAGYLFTASFRALPGLKATALRAGTFMTAPV